MAPASKTSLQRRLGFENYYGMIFWATSSFLLVLLAIVRSPLLTAEGVRNWGPPGEWYWYKEGVTRWGFTIHLATVIPVSFLVPLQFVPYLRRRYLEYHRRIGNIILILLIPAIASAVQISPHSFGGSFLNQSALFTTAISVSVSLIQAWRTIKRLEIDAHRRWMLRAMFWMSTIVTERIFLGPTIYALSGRGYQSPFLCEEARVTFKNDTAFQAHYPICNTLGPRDIISVPAVWIESDELSMTSLIRIGFGVSWWLALLVHFVGVECYLWMTPAEDEKLKKQSKARQAQVARLREKQSAKVNGEAF